MAKKFQESNQDTATRLIAFWAILHDTIVGAVEEGLGQRGLRAVLYQPLFDAGYEAATQKLPNAIGIADEIMRLERDFNLRGRILEMGPDCVMREVTECPWTNVRPAACHVFAWWMEGYCQGLNPTFRYQLKQLVPEGAHTCVWTITRHTR